jgi:hypothetical protein
MRRLALACIVLAGSTCLAIAGEPSRPAVVELFTSEGCSSCPPAEAYLGELARRPDVLALAFHVDYWDELGWHDRFGIAAATPRQRGYAQSLRLSTIYTPQMVIDGKGDFVGSDRARIERSLSESRTGLPVAMSVSDGILTIDLPESRDNAAGDVVLVAYLSSANSAIGRGENAGRTLTEFNVVRSIRVLGRYDARAQTYRAELASLPADATDAALLVQSSGQGRILAAGHVALRNAPARTAAR